MDKESYTLLVTDEIRQLLDLQENQIFDEVRKNMNDDDNRNWVLIGVTIAFNTMKQSLDVLKNVAARNVQDKIKSNELN